MLNLNLNINSTSTLAGGPIKTGFVPNVYPDPYSASLIVAIPGQIFYENGSNLFGSTTPYADIANVVKGTGSPRPLSIVGTNASQIKGINVTKWDVYGYTSSLYVPAEAAINAGTSSNNIPGQDFNFFTSSNWAVEAWVAFESESSQSPNHLLISKVNYASEATDSSYQYGIFTGPKIPNPGGNIPTGIGQFALTSSLAMKIYNTGSALNVVGYQTYWPTSSLGSNTGSANLQWNHIAFSQEIVNGYPTYRGFWNGRMIIEQTPTNQQSGNPKLFPPNLNGDTDTLLMGVQLASVGFYNDGGYLVTGSQTPMYFQDFRAYNGTNKNYTSSFNVNTVYPIVLGRP